MINSSACDVLQTARRYPDQLDKVYAGHNGILGALTEDLIDTSLEPEHTIAALKHTPGAAFGSCRYKLGPVHEHRAEYARLIEVFRAHDIGFFFYNGGGDSQDTTLKISEVNTGLADAVVCVGIPKTVDNDLTITTTTPAKLGDTVLVTGNVSTNKDFGAGYKYTVILDGAKVTVE